MPKINLAQVQQNSQEAENLFKFFAAQAEQSIEVWKKDTTYQFVTGENFQFEHDLFRRRRKKIGGIQQTEVRYEVISNEPAIGEGGCGTVHLIEGTVALSENTYRFKTQRSGMKTRVAKIQKNIKDSDIQGLQHEYTLSSQAIHLGLKEPAFSTINFTNNTRTSYITMNRFPGRELFDIILEDRLQTRKLTTQERIDLSITLLRALKEQATDLSLIHRDIKPENIIVDFGPPFNVNIIDYDFVMHTDNPDNRFCGTPEYIAPEVYYEQRAEAKSDVYSIGRILAEIWGVSQATYFGDDPNEQPTQLNISPKQLLKSLFTGIKGLTVQANQLIHFTLLNMLNKNPDKRFSIDESLYLFSAVQKLNSIKSASKSNASMFSEQSNIVENEPAVTLSCFSEDNVIKIKAAINSLTKEINSSWPYPNKDRKMYKLAGLTALLDYSGKPEITVSEVIKQVKENFNFEKLVEGKLSKRTKTLFNELEQSIPSTVSIASI